MKILVTTDFSPESEKACTCAASLGERIQAEVVLLAVFDPAVFVPTGSTTAAAPAYYADIPVETRLKTIESLEALGAKYFSRLSYSCIVEDRERSIDDTILRTAQRLPADLIVMATHGRSGLQRLLLGSVAEAVVRSSGIPVLLVPIRD